MDVDKKQLGPHPANRARKNECKNDKASTEKQRGIEHIVDINENIKSLSSAKSCAHTIRVCMGTDAPHVKKVTDRLQTLNGLAYTSAKL